MTNQQERLMAEGRGDRLLEALRCGKSGCPCAKAKPGRAYVHCPAHDDVNPSLSVGEQDGKLLVHCQSGCGQDAVIAALKELNLWPTPERNGHSPKQRTKAKERRYEVRDEAGELVAVHVRGDGSGGKSFTWERPDGNNGLGGLPVPSLPLYGTETLAGLSNGTLMVLCEGEKATDALRSVGIAAVGTVTGAGGTPGDSVLERLVPYRLALWPDNDEPGRQHMTRIAARLSALRCQELRLVSWPDAPPKGDAADAVAQGVDVAALVADAKPWKPGDVDLATLLDQVATFIGQYVIMSPDQLVEVALWVLHTYVYRAGDTSPYQSIHSAEKRSGKTRLLEVMDLLVSEPLQTANISVAALAHSLTEGCTLLLDEVDTLFKKGHGGSEAQEMLRGVLDKGYRVGGYYVRMAGQGAAMKPQRFDCFGPKALAGIGRLPGTLADRSIDIELKRRTRAEAVRRFRIRDARDAAAPMREQLAGWGAFAFPQIEAARPDIPEELDDRAQDSWEPLLAIADLAGGEWPAKARSAALVLSGIDVEDDTLGVRLLADLRGLFGDDTAIPTADLVVSLNAIEEAPWPGFHKGKGLSARDLADYLRPYGIRPGNIRIGDATLKGYKLADFEDAFFRYIPSDDDFIRHTATSGTGYAQNRSATRTVSGGGVADGSQARPTHGVADVADELPLREVLEL